MTKNKLILLLLIPLFPVLIMSCHKEEENTGHSCGEPFTSYITSADLLNLAYHQGSYWVYIDSVTNATDSVYVTGNSNGFIHDDCFNSFENYSFGTTSYPSMKQAGYLIVSGGLFKNPFGANYHGTQIYNDYKTPVTAYNFIATPHDSVFIFDQYYTKVLKVQVDKDPTENNAKSIYYINSEYGFLRHDIYADTGLVSQKILMRRKIVR